MAKPGNCIFRRHSALAVYGGGLRAFGLFGLREAGRGKRPRGAGRGPRAGDCGTTRARPNDIVAGAVPLELNAPFSLSLIMKGSVLRTP